MDYDPVIELHNDLEIFLDVLDVEPNSEIRKVGTHFLDLMLEYNRKLHTRMHAQMLEDCWTLPMGDMRK